jgi:hypothetical protein
VIFFNPANIFSRTLHFSFFTAYSRTSSSFIVNFQSFVRTVFFSNADAKVATFFEPANISASFFTKKLKKSEKQARKGLHLIYKKAAAARYILLRQQQHAQATPLARKSATRKTGRSAETFSMRGLKDSPADRRTSIYSSTATISTPNIRHTERHRSLSFGNYNYWPGPATVLLTIGREHPASDKLSTPLSGG